MLQIRETTTPREKDERDFEREMFDKQADHALRMKGLEIELQKEIKQARLEIMRQETKWNALMKIPLTIVRLPVLFVLAFKKPTKEFWKLLG